MFRDATIRTGYLPAPRSAVEDGLERASLPWFGDEQEAVTFLETRSEFERHSLEQISRLMGGEPTTAGLSMNADTALRVATVFACVRVIAEDVAKLPRQLKKREKDGNRYRTTKAEDDPRYDLLSTSPNDWMTGQELMEYMVGQSALRGASYAYLNRNGDDVVDEILPLLPGRCIPHQDENWNVTFQLSGYGATAHVDPRNIWRINGPMFGTLVGADISRYAREAIALAAAIEGSQSRFHASDSRPSGALTTKTPLKKEQKETIRDEWRAAYGPGGRGGIAVLDAEFEFKPITQTAADSQVIENRQFQIEDICRAFRVHPWAIMRLNSSQSYSSLEQTAAAHREHTLMPWVTRVEQTTKRDILNGDRDRPLFLKLNVDAIARATLADRVNAYGNAVKVYLTPNEIRELEDRDPMDDAAMDRVQLQANNTGLSPGGSKGSGGSTPNPSRSEQA